MSTDAETISVVVPNYNGRQYLGPLLSALRRQDRPADEVIVVDDASTDDSVAHLREHAPEVRVVALSRNEGFVGAVNAGIAAATGSLIALLNNDTVPQPGWLRALEAELRAHPEAGSAASKLLFAHDSSLINSAGIGCTEYGMCYDIGYGCPDGQDYGSPREVFGASAGAALYRRSLFETVGTLDPALVMWYEDVDLSFRAQLYGYRCRYAPDAVVLHVAGGTVRHRSPRSNYFCARNQVVVWLKNLPADLLVRLLPGAVWLYLKHSIKMLVVEHDTVPLRGYAAAFLLLPHIMRERRRLLPRRRISSEALRRFFVSKAVAQAQIRLPA